MYSWYQVREIFLIRQKGDLNNVKSCREIFISSLEVEYFGLSVSGESIVLAWEYHRHISEIGSVLLYYIYVFVYNYNIIHAHLWDSVTLHREMYL